VHVCVCVWLEEGNPMQLLIGFLWCTYLSNTRVGKQHHEKKGTPSLLYVHLLAQITASF